MPLYDDEMNKRREKREAQRRRREAERKRMRVMLILAAVVLALCGAGIYMLAKNAGASSGVKNEESTLQTQAATQPTEETRQEERSTTTTIHIRAAGDLNVTDRVVEAGLAIGGYDYSRAFMDVAALLSSADLTLLNLEGNICGEPYGSATGSAPVELLTGLRNAGVDMLQVANSCSVRNGLIGLSSTLQAIRSAGLEPVGAFASESEFNSSGGYTITEIQGIKVAFVAFTKGVGGMGMPAGNENLVNLLYEDYSSTYKKVDTQGINQILRAVDAQKPDITVALLHWGSEYNDEISSTQESIVSLMQKRGVDIIIGTHPHMVQHIDYDPVTGNLVAYSLGDFFGDASRAGTNYSIILDLEITRDTTTGITRVTDYSYIPIYTLKEEDCDGYRRVVRIDAMLEAYDENYLDKITKAAYESMQYSLERIEDRVTPPEEEED